MVEQNRNIGDLFTPHAPQKLYFAMHIVSMVVWPEKHEFQKQRKYRFPGT